MALQSLIRSISLISAFFPTIVLVQTPCPLAQLSSPNAIHPHYPTDTLIRFLQLSLVSFYRVINQIRLPLAQRVNSTRELIASACAVLANITRENQREIRIGSLFLVRQVIRCLVLTPKCWLIIQIVSKYPNRLCTVTFSIPTNKKPSTVVQSKSNLYLSVFFFSMTKFP